MTREQTEKELRQMPEYVVYLAGDTHGRFDRIEAFCRERDMEQENSEYHGGAVWVEPQYPNIVFAIDGEVYDFCGHSCLVIGGAYSVDKWYRLARGFHWWPDEQPSEEIRREVETVLERRDWQVDVVLSHTCPLKYEPREVFLKGLDQSTVDKSTEEWLGKIELRLRYQRWY